MVQDSSKTGPEVFNLRSLNFWRVHALHEIACKMLCIWAFLPLFRSQMWGGWSPAPAWTRVVLQYLLYDSDILWKKWYGWVRISVRLSLFFPSSPLMGKEGWIRGRGLWAPYPEAVLLLRGCQHEQEEGSRGHEESESVMGRVKTQPCPSRMEPGTVVIQTLPVLSLGVGAVRRGREIRGKGLPDTIWESLCKEWKVTRWEHWHSAPLSQCRICLWWVQRAAVFYLVMGSTWKPFQTLRAWLRDYKRFCGLERKVGKPLV